MFGKRQSVNVVPFEPVRDAANTSVNTAESLPADVPDPHSDDMEPDSKSGIQPDDLAETGEAQGDAPVSGPELVKRVVNLMQLNLQAGEIRQMNRRELAAKVSELLDEMVELQSVERRNVITDAVNILLPTMNAGVNDDDSGSHTRRHMLDGAPGHAPITSPSRDSVEAAKSRVQPILLQRIDAGKALGEISPEIQTQAAAALFIGTIQGLVMQSLLSNDLQHLRNEAAAVYAGATPLDHPGVSPLFADPTGYPPTLIQTGMDEILLSDSTRLAERLEAAGVDVRLDLRDGLWHVYPILAGYMPEATEALVRAAAFIRSCTPAPLAPPAAQASPDPA